MLNSKKAVALVGLLGGLALSGGGVAHASADGAPVCTRDAEGNRHCSQHSESKWTSKDGRKVVVEQSRECTSYERNRTIGPLAHGDGKVRQGASQSCSNSA